MKDSNGVKADDRRGRRAARDERQCLLSPVVQVSGHEPILEVADLLVRSFCLDEIREDSASPQYFVLLLDNERKDSKHAELELDVDVPRYTS